MNKKIFSVLSFLLVLSMLLTACGAAEEPAATDKVLHVWIQWGDNPQQIQELFDKYTAETG